MISATELTAMQAEAEKALPDTAQIYKRMRVSDGMGGSTVSENPPTTAACRVDAPRDQSVIAQYADRIGTRQVFIVSLPAGTDAQVGDRLEIGGRSHEVIAILSGSWEIIRRALTAVQG
jgi:hypothetical protein